MRKQCVDALLEEGLEPESHGWQINDYVHTYVRRYVHRKLQSSHICFNPFEFACKVAGKRFRHEFGINSMVSWKTILSQAYRTKMNIPDSEDFRVRMDKWPWVPPEGVVDITVIHGTGLQAELTRASLSVKQISDEIGMQ